MTHALKPSQHGSALITALLIVALAVALTGGIVTYLRIDIARTHTLISQNEAFIAAKSAYPWAQLILKKDWENQRRGLPSTDWQKLSWQENLNHYRIHASIIDAQSFYNINNLQDNTRLNNFHQLMQTLLPKVDIATIPPTTLAINLWLNPNARSGPLQTIYKKLMPPYSPSGRLFTHRSELALVNSITPEIYKNISPYIIALPQSTPLNINTANNMALITLGQGLTLENAEKIIQLRQQQGGFKTTEQFLSNPLAQAAQITANQITLTSDYFLLRTEIIYPSHKQIVLSLLKRLIVNGKMQIIILWETYGS